MWLTLRLKITRGIAVGTFVLGLVLALMGGLGPARAETKFAAGTSWVNEDGAVLAITGLAANGQLTGTFTTQTGCGARKPHPVTGWYVPGGSGGALTFAVNWEGCNSVTTWSAQYNNAVGSFGALWHLAVASAPVWNGIVAGASLFVVQPAKKQ